MKHDTLTRENDFFGKEKISRILLQIAPPVMLAQLIQALYNIVDSFFVGRYSANALTALSVIYPLQLIIVALAVGTGVGLNTYMARKYAQQAPEAADAAAGTGVVLALGTWAVFAVLSTLFMGPYVRTSATSPEAIADAIVYGRIVCVGSLGAFLEGCWTKVHQAQGNMRLPMVAQIIGALTNIVLDPLLIFGLGPVPSLGVAGAALATVAGQIAAAVITGLRGYRRPPHRRMAHYARQIYKLGYPSILMQALYTVYIVGLNMILAGFTDAAVTVLGLYYKLQTFFFIPLLGLQTCIVPVISYNYARAAYRRCRDTVRCSVVFSLAVMAVGAAAFILIPGTLIRVFSQDAEVLSIGCHAFPIIGASFLPAVVSLMMPVFFQAIGYGRTSLSLSLLRQIVCLLPLFYLLARFGLGYTWFAFPLAELISVGTGLVLYLRVVKQWQATVS
ncbi:MATE family efflux transporter [Gemmiger sp.]